MCFLTGRTDRAIPLWQRAVEGDPVSAFRYRANIAEGYQQIGLLGRAETANRNVLAVTPDYALAIKNKGLVALLRGDAATAVRGAERILTIEGADARTLLSAGMLLLYAGEPRFDMIVAGMRERGKTLRHKVIRHSAPVTA